MTTYVSTDSRELRDAMTVRQLREMLEGLEPDAKVLIVCDYGDYSHTQQALPIKEVTELEYPAMLVKSAYSHSQVAIEEYEPEDDEEEDELEKIREGMNAVLLHTKC